MTDNLCIHDDILEGITFEELITTIQCNESEINLSTIKRVFKEILESRLEDARHTLNENIQFIKSNL